MSNKKQYIPIAPPFSWNAHLDNASSERPTGSFLSLKNYIPKDDILRTREGITSFVHTPEATVVITNDFSGDANCLCWYKMDTFAGNTFADSKGSNPVTGNQTGVSAFMTIDTTNVAAPGLAASIAFNNVPTQNSAWGTIAYTDQGTPLPGSVGVDTTFSICAWYRWTANHTGNGRTQPIASRWAQSSAARCWLLDVSTGNTSLRFLLRDTSNANYAITSTLTVTPSAWYHCKVTYNSATLTSTMRICDSSGTTVYTGNRTLPNGLITVNQSMQIGTFDSDAAQSRGGNLQELVIFNDIVTDVEQDQIIAGTYL